MKNKKIITMALILLLIITIANVVNADVPKVIGANKTEAVEKMDTASVTPAELPGSIIPINKLKQYQMLEGEEDKLFIASPKCDLESIVKEFKNGTGEIDSSSKYYAQLEKIANGKNFLYLPLKISMPKSINKVRLLTDNSDLLLGKDGFNYIKQNADDSYTFYLEFALKSGDYWEIGAGIQELEKELIFECYTKSTDTTPVKTSKVVITPKDINYVADSEETKNYAITKEGKFIEIDTVEANDNNTYPAQLQIPERLKNKFSYDAKTDTVTMDNVGTAGKNTFIIISSKNFYIKGNNNIDGEVFLTPLEMNVKMDPKAVLDCFLTHTLGVEVNINYEEMTNTTYVDRTVTEKGYGIIVMTKLQSTKLFSDVKQSDWYYNAVKYMKDNRYMSGTTETTYSPSSKLTRGMLVTILHNMEGKPKVTGTSKFSDVQNKNMYYYSAVLWASNNKIVNGYTNGKFGANDNITREQLAVMLSNYCKYKGKYKATNANYSKFSDSGKISGYAKIGMNWAVGHKIVNGSNGKLNPQGTANRAEAAAMIYNYCNRIK